MVVLKKCKKWNYSVIHLKDEKHKKEQYIESRKELKNVKIHTFLHIFGIWSHASLFNPKKVPLESKVLWSHLIFSIGHKEDQEEDFTEGFTGLGTEGKIWSGLDFFALHIIMFFSKKNIKTFYWHKLYDSTVTPKKNNEGFIIKEKKRKKKRDRKYAEAQI